MRRRPMLFLCSAALVAPAEAFAQSGNKIFRIGLLFGDAPAPHEEHELLEGLRENGLVEGRNLIIERRYAEGKWHLVPGYGRELAALKLDAVISTCTPTTRIVQQVFGTTPDSTPIVMAAVADPVGQKIIASLARPGANVTGLASQAEDIMPKMLSLFADVLERPATVAVLVDAGSHVHPNMWRALAPAAQQLNLKLIKVEAGRKPGEPLLSTAFETAVQAGAKGIFVLPDEPFFFANRAAIVSLATRHRLPSFFGIREFVDDGGLMSYGESMRAAFRGVGAYISKVTAGQKPGSIPVTQPTRFELVINLKTAKSLGLAFPQSMLLSADSVIQ